MKQAIWKYRIAASQKIPKAAKFLSVQTQDNLPMMWFLVDPTKEAETRHFVILPTGGGSTDTSKLEFLGTFQLDGGAFVGHVFERRES